MPSRYAPSDRQAIADDCSDADLVVSGFSRIADVVSGFSRTRTAASDRATGASRITASTIRCIVTSFTPMSNVRFSSSTCSSETSASTAPSGTVRGRSSSTPASTSTHPVAI